MVNQRVALQRLNWEKAYEDALVSRLGGAFLASIDRITGLSAEQRQKVREGLSVVLRDSQRHAFVFNSLIEMVLENGELEY